MEQDIVMHNVHMTSNSSMVRQIQWIGNLPKLILTLVVDIMDHVVQKWIFGRLIPDLKHSPLTLVKQLDHLDAKELIVEITRLEIGNNKDSPDREVSKPNYFQGRSKEFQSMDSKFCNYPFG